MKEFISPQTGSAYKVFAEVNGFKICFRQIEDEDYRVRIQNDDNYIISKVRDEISWGDIKHGDHLSVVVVKKSLVKALCKALQVVVDFVGIESVHTATF